MYYRYALLSATSFCFWQSAGALFWAFLKCYLHPRWTSALFFNTACTFWYLQRKRVILLCSRRIHWSTGQLNQMNVKRGKGLRYFNTFKNILDLRTSAVHRKIRQRTLIFMISVLASFDMHQQMSFPHFRSGWGLMHPLVSKEIIFLFPSSFPLSSHVEMHLKGKMTRLPSYCSCMWPFFKTPFRAHG